jgi:hypothetical protein
LHGLAAVGALQDIVVLIRGGVFIAGMLLLVLAQFICNTIV